jgi:hypothetical protein
LALFVKSVPRDKAFLKVQVKAGQNPEIQIKYKTEEKESKEQCVKDKNTYRETGGQ